MNKIAIKKAFTMIELIFVIVIIGILAAVAIPKLVETRDNAEAKVCVSEVSIFILEMSEYYIKNGGWDAIEKITNLKVGVVLSPGNEQKGLTLLPTTVPLDDIPIVYACNGESILMITPQVRVFTDTRGVLHNEYELDVSDPGTATTQPAIIANRNLIANGIYKINPGYRIGGN